ncbi:hypothetical protein IWQ56_005739, partial [Coemansia nantahalensis]
MVAYQCDEPGIAGGEGVRKFRVWCGDSEPHHVSFTNNPIKFACDKRCAVATLSGIACRHICRVALQVNCTELPEDLFATRWLRSRDVDPSVMSTARAIFHADVETRADDNNYTAWIDEMCRSDEYWAD